MHATAIILFPPCGVWDCMLLNKQLHKAPLVIPKCSMASHILWWWLIISMNKAYSSSHSKLHAGGSVSTSCNAACKSMELFLKLCIINQPWHKSKHCNELFTASYIQSNGPGDATAINDLKLHAKEYRKTFLASLNLTWAIPLFSLVSCLHAHTPSMQVSDQRST